MSSQSVRQECQVRVLRQSVPQEVLRNSVKQECLTRVSNQRVKPGCSTSVSGRKWVLCSSIRVSIRVCGFHLVFSLETATSSSAKFVANVAVPEMGSFKIVLRAVVPNWLLLESMAVPTWMLQSCVEKVAPKLPWSSRGANLDASTCIGKVVVPNWDAEVAVPNGMLQNCVEHL